MEAERTASPHCYAGDVAVISPKGRLLLLYVDEQHLTRDCIGRELARSLPDVRVEVRANLKDAELCGPNGPKFDVVVVNVHADKIEITADRETAVGGVISELSLLEQLVPETPLVLLSDVDTPEDIIGAFQTRIRGYVPTTLPIAQVSEAIRFVLAGGTFVPQCILEKYKHTAPLKEQREEEQFSLVANFSPRQVDVLSLLWRGLSNKLIAYELDMCESTVKVHIRHIMKKLNVNNRTQVVLRTRRPTSDNKLQFERPDLQRSTFQLISVAPIEPAKGSSWGAPVLAK